VNIKDTIAIINQVQADGIIGRYAIGGAVGASFYLEVDQTFDIDVYILLDPLPGQLLVSLDPIHEYLEARGYHLDSQGYSNVLGWPVQFLPADEPLLKEALDKSVEKTIEDEVAPVPARVFTAEHLAAIAFELGRPKDKSRLLRFIAWEGFNEQVFSEILQRHNLLDRWLTFKKQMLG